MVTRYNADIFLNKQCVSSFFNLFSNYYKVINYCIFVGAGRWVTKGITVREEFCIPTPLSAAGEAAATTTRDPSAGRRERGQQQQQEQRQQQQMRIPLQAGVSSGFAQP